MYHNLHISFHSMFLQFVVDCVVDCVHCVFVRRFVLILLVVGKNHRVRSTTELNVQARIRNGSKQKLYVRDTTQTLFTLESTFHFWHSLKASRFRFRRLQIADHVDSLSRWSRVSRPFDMPDAIGRIRGNLAPSRSTSKQYPWSCLIPTLWKRGCFLGRFGTRYVFNSQFVYGLRFCFFCI